MLTPASMSDTNARFEQQYAADILENPVKIAQLRERAQHVRLESPEDVVTALRALGEEKIHRITRYIAPKPGTERKVLVENPDSGSIWEE